MLEYCGVDYEDVLYDYGPAPNYGDSKWFTVKPTLGLGPFANLPYFVDADGSTIVESMAIINHLSRKYQLDGNTEDERIRGDVMLYHLADVFNRFTGMCYSPNYEDLKPGFLKDLPGYLQGFQEYLGSNEYFAGANVTKVDFQAYEFFARVSIFTPGCLDAFPRLRAFVDRIANLPSIKKYLASDRYFTRPINGAPAHWK